MSDQQPMPASQSAALYESREVLTMLEERGVHLERESLSEMSDRLDLITRPPVNRCPRRWTLAQVEFIAVATRLWRLRSIESMAALAYGDSSLLTSYLRDVEACVKQVIEHGPAAHDESIAALHSIPPVLKTRAA